MSAQGSETPKAFWEERYSGSERVWSGRVNATLAAIVESLPVGRSLDLGCGEGGDVLWLAQRGWDATGVDLSETAIARATRTAAAHGLGSASFVAADLADWAQGSKSVEYDLITASFFQSPVALPRAQILRAAAHRVAPGGHLVLVAHAAPPSWAAHEHGGAGGRGHGPQDFPLPESELAALALDPARWEVLAADVRERVTTAPSGSPATLLDSVVVARRREATPEPLV